MKTKKLSSGLIIPNNKNTEYGPFEIQDEDDRALAKRAMSDLWDAMRLSKCGGILVDSKQKKVIYEQVYLLLGKMILGKDCPEKERY